RAGLCRRAKRAVAVAALRAAFRAGGGGVVFGLRGGLLSRVPDGARPPAGLRGVPAQERRGGQTAARRRTAAVATRGGRAGGGGVSADCVLSVRRDVGENPADVSRRHHLATRRGAGRAMKKTRRAKNADGPQPFILIEEAVHLLRSASAGDLALYLSGAVPWVLGGLFFWAHV